ncbi:MAG TPA: hypothetical protein PK890_06230 [Terrimesophilobacter sp.]|nr:hypothetical protein [Terrimesophilobacter sp.]
MNRRLLFPLVIASALLLSACASGPPAGPGGPADPPAAPGAGATEKPSGAEATVTVGGHVYEFSSDPALTWGKAHPGPCTEFMSTLKIDLWLVAVDGAPAEELDGSLTVTVSNPISESSNEVSITIKDEELELVAGAALTIVDVDDQPITLARDGYTISGSQPVYNRVYSAPEPRVVTAQIDARCVNF